MNSAALIKSMACGFVLSFQITHAATSQLMPAVNHEKPDESYLHLKQNKDPESFLNYQKHSFFSVEKHYVFSVESYPYCAFYQAENGNIYALTGDGGVKLSLHGKTFRQLASVPVRNNVITLFLQARNGDIYLGSGQGVFISHNGIDFRKIFDFPVNHLNQAKNGNIYVTVDTPSDRSGLYLTTDGIHFRKIKRGWGWFDFFQAANGDIYMESSLLGGLFLSRDGLDFKKLLDIGVIHLNQTSNGTLYGETSSGLFRSLDGIHFKKIFNINAQYFMETPTGQLYVGSYAQGLFTSAKGVSWHQVTGVPPQSGITLLKRAHNGDIYAGTYDHGLFIKHPDDDRFEKKSSFDAYLLTEGFTGGMIMLDWSMGLYYMPPDSPPLKIDPSLVKDLFVISNGFYTMDIEYDQYREQYRVFYWQY